MTLEERDLRLTQANAAFWKSTNLNDLAKERNIPVVTDLSLFAMPDWPEDESADDIASDFQQIAKLEVRTIHQP